MPTYTIDATTRIAAMARSSIHNTETKWSRISGTIDVDAEALGSAKASIAVDMREFDAGDFLKNRKLKKDLGVDLHPQATFELVELTDITRRDGGFDATASGVLRWRGEQTQVVARGTGTVTAERVEARASFELDVRKLGVTPPRILMFKVEPEVTIEVFLVAVRK